MPRTVVEDDDDAVPLSDLLRTGEASRLRRRGAMRTGHGRRDDREEDTAAHHAQSPPGPHRRLRVDEVFLELSCGVRSGDFSFSPPVDPSSSRPSPLPRVPSPRDSFDVGFAFASTGCGVRVSTKASPSTAGSLQVYTSTEIASHNFAPLSAKYLDLQQLGLALHFTLEECGCQCEWEAIGCRVCGNVLGFLYAPSHPRHPNVHTHPTHVFFPSSVTPSPSYAFPPPNPEPQLAPEWDDSPIDSPAYSPRLTRYFRSDADPEPNEQEVWPAWHTQPPDGEASPWQSWQPPDLRLVPTPPRSPAVASTPLAFSVRATIVPPPASVPVHESRGTDTRHAESPQATNTLPPSNENENGAGYAYTFWRDTPPGSPPRAAERERPPRSTNPNDASHPHRDSHDSGQQPLPPPASLPLHSPGWIPRELRERAPGALVPGERAMDRLGLFIGRPGSDLSERAVQVIPPLLHRVTDPPALHRAPRRTLAPAARRAASASFDARQYTGAGLGLVSPSRSPHRLDEREREPERERGLESRSTITRPGPGRRTTVPEQGYGLDTQDMEPWWTGLWSRQNDWGRPVGGEDEEGDESDEKDESEDVDERERGRRNLEEPEGGTAEDSAQQTRTSGEDPPSG